MNNKAYEKAGVSLEKGYETVSRIKKHISRTTNKGAISAIGSFGGLFDFTKMGFNNPLLVSGTDGVGTKLILAIESNRHETIGQDLVAMCVNDVLALGAQPLFFLDYFATGNLKPEVVETVVAGICDALEASNTALIGGETAEMPDMYSKDHYDLGGFVVGAVDRDKVINGEENVKEDEVLIAIASSGIHSNGYSLVRKIFFKDNNFDFSTPLPYDKSKTLIEELLTPTRIYTSSILDLIKKVKVNGIANITGGGFYENIPRMFNEDLAFDIDFEKVKVHDIFKWMQELSGASHEEMFSTFNMGVGMVVAVNKADEQKTIDVLTQNGEIAYTIGKVIKK